MTEAPLLPFVRPGVKGPPPAACTPRPESSVAWSPERNQPVEVVVPDRHRADLLVEYAAPTVPAELVPGAGWIVRLQAPPAAQGAWWMLEVMSSLDRRLESVPLPCAKLLYGGHGYLIGSSTEAAQPGPASRAVFASAHALAH